MGRCGRRTTSYALSVSLGPPPSHPFWFSSLMVLRKHLLLQPFLPHPNPPTHPPLRGIFQERRMRHCYSLPCFRRRVSYLWTTELRENGNDGKREKRLANASFFLKEMMYTGLLSLGFMACVYEPPPPPPFAICVHAH